jgi:hypothetical protein
LPKRTFPLSSRPIKKLSLSNNYLIIPPLPPFIKGGRGD